MSSLIGLLGGTFDPVHFGHLRTAIELYDKLSLSEMRLIPCYQPVHRATPLATPIQRLTMLQLAVAASELTIDTCEMERENPSYAYDTLVELKQKQPDDAFCLIMATDALDQFDTWHRFQDILTLAHLIIVPRPAYLFTPKKELIDLLNQHQIKDPALLKEKTAGSILFSSVTPLDISATRIRQLIAERHTPRFLLPDAVLKYIRQHNIYAPC